MKKITSSAILKNPVELQSGATTNQIEDRSAYLRSDSPVTWTGTQLTFTTDIILEILNTLSGTTTLHKILFGTSPISINNGDTIYVSVDRSMALETVTAINSSSTPIPAQSTPNKDVFILFKRIDVAGVAYLHLPFSRQVLNQGQSVRLGASGSGSGGGGVGVNLIGLDTNWNPVSPDDINADNTVGHWLAYQNTADIKPVDMTGGSPTVTISQTTTVGEVLNGRGSFKIVKDAANRQGEGVSVVTNIPLAYRGLTALIELPFKIISGSLLSGDLKLFIYDVTNGNVITPFNNDVTGIKGMLSASFPIPDTCAQLRFGFHFASTSAVAVSLSFDDIFVGINSNLAVAVPSGKQFFVSAQANTDSSSISGGFTTFSNSPTLTFTPVISGTYKVYSSIPLDNASSGQATGRIFNTSGSATLISEQHSFVWTNLGFVGGNPTCESTYTLTAGTSYSFDVQGQGSGITALGSSFAAFYIFAQLVSASPAVASGGNASLTVALTGTYVSAGGSGNPIKYDTILFDTAGGYKTSTGIYTVPSTGDYRVSVLFYSSTSGATNYQLYKNGTGILYIARATVTSGGSATISCNAGDTLYVAPDASTSFDGNVPYVNYLSIEQIPDSKSGNIGQVPRSEALLTGVNGNGSTNTSVLNFTSIDHNIGTALTPLIDASLGTSILINEDGIYSITLNVLMTTAGFYSGLQRNSTSGPTTGIGLAMQYAPTGNPVVSCSVTTILHAGDIIRPTTTGTGNTADTSGYNNLRIVKVSH